MITTQDLNLLRTIRLRVQVAANRARNKIRKKSYELAAYKLDTAIAYLKNARRKHDS